MAGRPLRPAIDRRFGGPLPRQLANLTRIHLYPPEFFTLYHAVLCAYAVLAVISNCYPPDTGRLSTRYSPVRHSVKETSVRRNLFQCFVRLACVKHAASVHPEPGSNSLNKIDLGINAWLIPEFTFFKGFFEDVFYCVIVNVRVPRFVGQLPYITSLKLVCQHLFLIFLKKFFSGKKQGRWRRAHCPFWG